MADIQEVLREMRLYAEDDHYGPDVGRWLIAIEAAMREPEAWKSIDREGIEDATVYEDTMQDWVRFGRRIVPLFAFPPDAAGEIKKITEAHKDALLDVQTALNEAKGDAEDWRDSYDSIVEEFRMRGAEIERLTLQRDAQAENATQWFDRANGREIEAKALRADNERLQRACVGAIRFLGLVKHPDAHRAEVLLRDALNSEEKK